MPDAKHEWMVSHAANPIAEPLDGERVRVYYNCRDRDNRSYIATFDFEPASQSVSNISEAPILGPGLVGRFDDSGVSIGCIVPSGKRRFLYYVGWNLGVTVPWRNTIGLAISDGPDEPFERFGNAPLLDRSHEDPYSLSYPWILREGNLWRMWYGSNLEWGKDQSSMKHVIKYAESDDGILWRREGHVSVGLNSDAEIGLSRPCIVRSDGLYRMWYSIRGTRYRIGYAESLDGVRWTRKDDQAGIDVSPTGWDGDEIEYPFVFEHRDTLYMLYNGNGYGRTGIGLAELERG